MSNQLVKRNPVEGYKNVFPKTFIDAIKDRESGVSLEEILQGFNMYFLSYNGSVALTRCKVPKALRKEGLWITYVLYDHTVVTEWYNSDNIDDESWGSDSNWRKASNALVGDISISTDGYWVINGTTTNIKAQGETGTTPLLRVGDNNKIQVTYDEGKNWEDISDYIVPKFRWNQGTGTTAGTIQISMDLGNTWKDLSNPITNNLRISKYIGINESLPASGVAEGTVYMKGPYYDENDSLNENPIYRMWIYAWKGNTLAWQDNGEFTSISAGVVQERGTSTTQVMSQDAVTRELTELESEVIGLVGIIPLIANTEHSSNNDRVNVAIKEGTTFLITSRVNSELRYTATISGFDKDGNATRLGDINKSGGKLEGVATMDITQIGVYSSAGGNVSTSNMVLDIVTDKTMLPRLSEVETEIKKIDTELTTLNNQINGGVNIQSFSADLGTSGMLTDIVVTAGEEYIFEGNKCVTIYVDGFSSPNVEIPFGTYTPVSFKPSNSGYIRIYPHETGNLLLTATLINKGLIEEIKEDKEMRYVVGDGGDFPTLTSAFQSLKDDASQKTLVIRGGTYDLFDELGGQDWLDSIPNDSTDWRQYSLFVPKNTKVIGEGNVTLNFLLPDSIPYSKAILLSALNISGSVEVANITINAKNCRYAIHDEDGTDINNSNSVKRYTNVRLNKGGIGYEQAYGAGFGKNSSIEVDSCIFKTDRYPAFSTHNNFRGDNSTIVLKSCAFINEGGTSNVALSFRTSDSRDSSNVKVLVSSCYIGGKLGLDDNPNTENATNVFEVTLINSGSPQVTNASGRNTLEPLILNS